jgi:hypothetical protein
VSRDTRKDYDGAAQLFAATDKAHGWNESTCRQAADRFAAVVRTHSEVVEAQFMVGLSFHRCGLLDDAEKAYQGDPDQSQPRCIAIEPRRPVLPRQQAGDARALGQRDQGGRAGRERINIASLELSADAQDQQPEGRDEEARGRRAVQPVERARRR